MKRRTILLAGLVAVTVLGGLVWLILRSQAPPEPVFQGKRLSEWVAAKAQTDQDPTITTPAIEAVRQMGTNALPYLIHELRSKDALFWQKLPRSAYKYSWIRRIRGMAASERQQRAAYFLKALGPLADPAIPALSECLDRKDIAEQAAGILGYYDHVGYVGMGPEATLALLKAMTNGNANVRTTAANALGLLHTKPELVVPALIHALKDESPVVRCMAARSFGGYKADAAKIVPPLMEILNDEDPYVRAGAAWMLGRFRAQALAAVPQLQVLLNDRNSQVRKEATDALKLIDPEAAARAGFK